jgi:hypothetical protein
MSRSTPPAFLDIEASGFGRDSYPIEIGFVLPDGDAWCTLVRPEPDWTHWDPAAEALHGISRSLALRHGRPAVDVARELNRRLGGLTVYSDGWAHDYAWLALLFEAGGRSPSCATPSAKTRRRPGRPPANGCDASGRWRATGPAATPASCSSPGRPCTGRQRRRPDQRTSGPRSSSAARRPAQ